jgi:protein-S-isoprenylcysteine O-methyltransferase
VVGGLRKALQAAAIWGLALLVLSFLWPPALRLPQLWMVLIVSSLVNILQPSYRPFEGSRTPEDRGTAVQILWTVYLTLIAAIVELVIRQRQTLPLDGTTWLVFAVMLGGLVLRSWAVLLLGPWFTWNVTVQAGQKLVCHGPYRLLRHPGYTGALVTFVAGCVLLRSWVTAGLAVMALMLAFQRRIQCEERLLLATLPGYDAYRARTGGLLPRILPRP